MVDGGRTHWGQRWRELSDTAGAANARRVQRGQALARRGAVDDLRLEPGRITGRVREDRVAPYTVELEVPVPGDAAWTSATEQLAAELRFTAALLEGELPADVEPLLEAAGIPLVPTAAELVRRCTCAERTTWCRHVAAVHSAAGLAIDRDPFQLLRLRGRDRDTLLRTLRADRDGGLGASTQLDLAAGLEGALGDLDAVVLAPAPVDDPSALVRQLGDPPGVDDPTPLVDVIERAAATAWRLAAGEGSSAADEELLLAELRAQRVATPAALADALGRDAEDVRDELDQLFAAGTVMRTGSGDRTRYRAG